MLMKSKYCSSQGNDHHCQRYGRRQLYITTDSVVLKRRMSFGELTEEFFEGADFCSQKTCRSYQSVEDGTGIIKRSGAWRLTYLPDRISSQNITNLVRETVRVKRFAKKAVEAGFASPIHLFNAGLSRNCNDRNLL